MAASCKPFLLRDLYVLMAELATDPSNHHKLEEGKSKVNQKMVNFLEEFIDEITSNFELPKELNSRSREEEIPNIIFHHFSGKHKPWTIKGFDQKHSSDFHQFYKYIYRRRYLITTSNFKNGKKHLKSYLSKKFKFDLKNIIFVYHSIVSLIKKVLN